jgi:iron complex transport system substrate-binding protein
MTAQRIVSLLPSATEIVYALGIGDRLVGVTHECDYPDEARSKPILTASSLSHSGRPGDIDRHVRRAVHEGSSLYTLDAELLESLAPDLILTQELCEVCAVSYGIVARAVRSLRSDPRLVSLEPSSLDDMYATIATVGELTGTGGRATEVIAELRARVDRLRASIGPGARPRVLVLEWTDPPMSAGHWTPELVDIAGGTPVLGNAGANSTTLSWEAIALADPDLIIVTPCGFDLEKTHAAIAELNELPAWRELRAVRSGNVFAVDGNAYVNRPGPRLVDSAEIFAGHIASAAEATRT